MATGERNQNQSSSLLPSSSAENYSKSKAGRLSMVQFGKALKEARRKGWEDVFLDYDGMQKALDDIESFLLKQRDLPQQSPTEQAALLAKDDQVPSARIPPSRQKSRSRTLSSWDCRHMLHMDEEAAAKLDRLKASFFAQLQSEIEKISLFSLKKQGQMADAVGAIRFENAMASSSFSRKSIETTFTQDRLDSYAALSVELAHVLKFICVNSVGIQKILKKYNKIFEKMDEPHFYVLESAHLKQMANSENIVAIQASFQAVLTECFKKEDVRNPQVALALLRFQCILECSTILRRYANTFHLPFLDFLSKHSMIVTQTNFGGTNIKGQQALQWLLDLQPQKIRQMDQTELERMWLQWSKKTEFVQAHLGGGLPYGGHHRRVSTYTGDDALEMMIAAAKETTESDTSSVTKPLLGWGGVRRNSMYLNLFSILLYTVNYYIVAPTANHYAINLGTDGAYGATLIGASSFSALFAAFVYSIWYTRSTFKSALLFSTVCPLIGNLIYSLALSYESMEMAIIGRLLCGFGSAEVLNRQLIATCVRFDAITAASALFVAFGAGGMSIGPLIAGILDLSAGRDYAIDVNLPLLPAGGIIYNYVTAPGFVMAALWMFQLLGLIFLFEEPVRVNNVEYTPEQTMDVIIESERKGRKIFERQDSTGSTEYGAMSISQRMSFVSNDSLQQKSGLQYVWGELVSTWKLVFKNPGLPVTLLIFAFIEMACEIIISSCSMIVRRYFGWNGSAAGFFIASLGALVIPAHFVVEMASHYFSERRILMRSLIAVTVCTILLFNYSGIFYDILGGITVANDAEIKQIKKQSLAGIKVKHILTPDGEIYYNWGYGVFFYVPFLSLLFMSTIVLEGVDTSIMAKITPPRLNEKIMNCGLLATLLGTLGRVLADSVLTVSALLDINIFIDFVNATFLPVFLLAILGIVVVNRTYLLLV